MHSQSVLHARILRLYFLVLEAQAEALAIDHLDPDRWDELEERRPDGHVRGRGGVLWHIIDGANAKMMALRDRSFP